MDYCSSDICAGARTSDRCQQCRAADAERTGSGRASAPDCCTGRSVCACGIAGDPYAFTDRDGPNPYIYLSDSIPYINGRWGSDVGTTNADEPDNTHAH